MKNSLPLFLISLDLRIITQCFSYLAPLKISSNVRGKSEKLSLKLSDSNGEKSAKTINGKKGHDQHFTCVIITIYNDLNDIIVHENIKITTCLD